MKKYKLIAILAVVASFFLYHVDWKGMGDTSLGGGNLPDRSEIFSSAASASGEHMIKGSSAKLFSCKVYNESIFANAYFQLFNIADEPHFNSTPIYSFAIPASTSTVFGGYLDLANGFFFPAVEFGTGLAFGISSDDDTYSSASITAANYDVSCQYY